MPRPLADPLKTGLPSSPDCERYCLSAIMLGKDPAERALRSLTPEDFSLEKHRRIFLAMKGLVETGVEIDRQILAEKLLLLNQLESVGGLTMLVSLDEGMPEVANVQGYIDIVKEKSSLRRLISLTNEAQQQALLQNRSSAEILSGLSERIAAESTEKREDRPQVIADYVDTFPGGVGRLLDPSMGDPGIPTGFERVDRLTGGFHAGEIWIIGARPRVGKTCVAVNILKSITEKQDKHCVFFSLEMPKRGIVNRLLCEEAMISMARFRSGNLDQEDRRRLQLALDKIYRLKMHIDSLPTRRMYDLRMRLKALSDKYAIALVAIDYFQLLQSRSHGNENERLTEIANDIQQLSSNTGIPFLVLSQLSREPEKRTSRGKPDARPRLGDLRGTGSAEQIGNVIGLLHREELYDKTRPELRGKAELNLEKVRDGESAVVPLKFTGWRFRFEDAEESPDSTRDD